MTKVTLQTSSLPAMVPAAVAAAAAAGEEESLVLDSSVDFRGQVPLRSSTGAWRAAIFVIVIEFVERMSYYGIATNLIIYLTEVLHEDVKTAARNVSLWMGFTTLMPLAGGFVADAYLGRYSTVLLSSLIYLAGLGILGMTQVVPSLKPSGGGGGSAHRVAFFAAIYMISVATGGHKPALESFGADQFDDDHDTERLQKTSFFNWWNVGVCSGIVTGVTAVAYLMDNVGWGVGDAVLAAATLVGTIVLLVGRPFYRYRAPQGSPLTPMARVVAAAIAKRNLVLPSNSAELYEVASPPTSETKMMIQKQRLLHHTNKFRLIDKAAVIERDVGGGEAEEMRRRWRLATVTEAEELKLVLSMAPIWLTSLPIGVCVTQASTFFIKQASVMDRRISTGFTAPPASVFSVGAGAMIVSICIYDRALVPCLRRITGNERGITVLQRIGVGMFFTAMSMAAAAVVERKRLLSVSPPSSSSSSSGAMSVLWLVPQFMIWGFGDGFTVVGLQEFFYDQAPDGMRSLGIGFFLSVVGAGSFLSGILITAVDRLTKRSGGGGSGGGGGGGWFGGDLNHSRLDKFYWLLAGINMADLCIFVFLANRYSYKKVVRRAVADHNDGTP